MIRIIDVGIVFAEEGGALKFWFDTNLYDIVSIPTLVTDAPTQTVKQTQHQNSCNRDRDIHNCQSIWILENHLIIDQFVPRVCYSVSIKLKAESGVVIMLLRVCSQYKRLNLVNLVQFVDLNRSVARNHRFRGVADT
jgi:hypothetical protein